MLHGEMSVTDDGQTIDDTWTTSSSIRALGDTEWTGKTYFPKQPEGQVLDHSQINEVFVKMMNCSSQGGYLVMFYDKDLEVSPDPKMVSITSWKSTKLKRKTLNTLSAECQAMILGVGNIHWHRFLLLELLGQDMTDQQWEEKLTSIPFVSIVDSRSLYDCLNKLVCTYAQIEDKRTAIDVAILKDDLKRTGGHVRWIAGTNMIADPLTKRTKSDFLRLVCNTGYWTLNAQGHQRMLKDNVLLLVTIHRQ